METTMRPLVPGANSRSESVDGGCCPLPRYGVPLCFIRKLFKLLRWSELRSVFRNHQHIHRQDLDFPVQRDLEPFRQQTLQHPPQFPGCRFRRQFGGDIISLRIEPVWSRDLFVLYIEGPLPQHLQCHARIIDSSRIGRTRAAPETHHLLGAAEEAQPPGRYIMGEAFDRGYFEPGNLGRRLPSRGWRRYSGGNQNLPDWQARGELQGLALPV